jgi:NADPH:quinone reductase-like Zn-dependent oxidoreductase
MARRYKIMSGVVAFLAVTLAALGLYVSHDAKCPSPPALAADAQRMKAIVYRCYGGPEVLSFEDVAKPVLEDDRILVKVHAAAVNPLDWHYMRGTPYLVRVDGGIGAPKNIKIGVDFAGVVEAVGKNVKMFKPGDEVFGGASGALAEYVTVREQRAVVLKPTNMSFEQAATVPIAAVTALQALRDKGKVRSGQKVLINGASGGVGTFAVQIAKSYGAEVTGVCSTRNVEIVRSIGADHVIDYKQIDFTQGSQQYDLIIDAVGNHALSDLRRVLTPSGTLVVVGGAGEGNWIGPLERPVNAAVYSLFVSQTFVSILAELNPQDLNVLRELMQAGKLTPVIDRRYPLSETPAAITYLEEGRARGKVIVNVVPPG